MRFLLECRDLDRRRIDGRGSFWHGCARAAAAAGACLGGSLAASGADELDPFHYPIYANIEWSEAWYVPPTGAGTEVADHCQTQGNGPMTSFEFGYFGPSDGTVSTIIRFYASQPPDGLIAQFDLPDLVLTGGYLRMKHVAVDPPVQLPDDFWVSAEFAASDVGLLTAALDAHVGDSEDFFWLEGQGLVSFSGDTPSNFMFIIMKEENRPEDFSFSDQTLPALATTDDLGPSVAFVDYDLDGRDDLYAGADNVYHNSGDGTFAKATLPGLNDDGERGRAWADFDNDGDLDVMTHSKAGLERVFRNDDGVFTELTDAMQGAPGEHDDIQCLGWGDYNSDGLLDCYAANLGNPFDPGGTGQPDRLWRNNGNDTFTNVVGTEVTSYKRCGRGVAWQDFDGDGDMDLYVSNDFFQPNHLFKQKSPSSFVDYASSLDVAGADQSAGSSWGDYDNDGDGDLIAPAIHLYPFLYHNDAVFTERSAEAGLHLTGEWAGGHFVDMNNDGWLDLYLHKWYQGQHARFFLSNGPVGPEGQVTFTQATFEVGGWRIDSQSPGSGTWADYDNDGDMDLVTSWAPDSVHQQVRVMRNELSNGNHWLHVALVCDEANATGIGARITITAGGLTQMRQVTPQAQAGTGFSHRAHFGLGSATTIDNLIVRWPAGEVSEFTDLGADQILVIEQHPQSIDGDLDGDGDVDVLDLLALLSDWGPCPPPPQDCPADLDANGTVDVLDLLILLGNWT